MQRYNIISKLANLSISNLGKHKKIVILVLPAFSPVPLVSQSPVRLALPLVSPVPLVPALSILLAFPILPAFSALSEKFSSIPSLYFRYRKDTGSPKDYRKMSKV